MSTHVGDIFFDAKIDRKQYDKGLSGLEKSASALSKKIGALFTIGALVKFTKDATKAGASLNAMGTIIDASLPNMTKQVDEFAKSAGAMFGLSETQAKGFVGKFASMASAMGYTEKQAYNMSTALTGLAGDVASYYHLNADEAYAKLGAVFTGETESLKSLGVVMTQNALDAFALANGFGKVTSQMTELEKTTLRYQFVMDRLKLASGDFAKYANTWSGSIATIKLNWANFMATVGQGIINVLLPLLQLIAKISNALTALGARFLSWTNKVTGKSKGLGKVKDAVSNTFGKGMQKDVNGASNSLGNVGNATKGVGNNAKKTKKEVQALKRELMGFDQITKLTKQDTNTGTTGASGAGGGGGGVDVGDVEDFTDQTTALGEAIDYLSKLKIPTALKEALDNLKSACSDLFGTLKSAGKWALDNVLKPLGEWFINDLLPPAINALANAIKVINSVLKLLGEILKPLWEPIIKPLFEFLGKVAVNSIQTLANILGTVATALDTAREKFVSFKEKWESIKEKAQELKLSLTDKFTATFDKIKEKWDGLKATTKALTLKIVDKFSDTWKKIRDHWNTVKKKFSGKKYSLTLQIVDKVTNAWKKIKNIWDKVRSRTAELKISITTAIASTYNSAVAKLRNSSIEAVKNFGYKLPYPLAQGGYVKANTPQLAIVGDNKREGEIVAPESKLEAMAKMASEGSNAQVVSLLTAILQTVNALDLDVTLDGESIKNNTVKRINNHTRSTGQLELIV